MHYDRRLSPKLNILSPIVLKFRCINNIVLQLFNVEDFQMFHRRIQKIYCILAGHYLYIETSLPRAAGDVARTDSPVLSTGSSKSCLSFFYNMKGATIGTLNVYINQNGANGAAVWSKSGKASCNIRMYTNCAKLRVSFILYVSHI